MSDLARLLRPFAGKIANLLARGQVAAVNAAGRMQILQLKLLGGELKDRLEHLEPYGFTSHPHPGSAEALAAFLDGDRSHGVVLVVGDRKYRMRDLVQGEVAIFDDQAQSVHLTRDGIVVKGGGLPMVFEDTPSITFKADTFIRFETPRVEATRLLMSMQYQMGGVTGGAGALTATFGAGTITWNGVTLNATGGSLTHNGKNIGGNHNHGGIVRGDENSNGPNPP